MKYVIWGAGQRGRRAYQLIGEKKVVAFIDNNVDKVGKYFCGKQIISLDEAIINFQDCIFVLTPADYSDEIEEELIHRNHCKYFRLDDCPIGISLDDEEDKIFETYLIEHDFQKCGIYGITLFSLLFYDHLKESYGAKVILSPQESFHDPLLNLIKGEYEVCDLKDSLREIDKLIIMTSGEEEQIAANYKSGIKIVEIDSLLDKSISFFNEEILKFKNIHQGKRCFIVATGPSLTVEDLEVLSANQEICISMNRIYSIFDRTAWRPNYYMIEDAKMIEDLAGDIASLSLDYKFVPAIPKYYWEQRNADTAIKYNIIVQDYKKSMPSFSNSIERCVYNGRTVTYACLQLAVYMGFKEIYLLGVDFNYSDNLYSPENHFEGYHSTEKKVRLNPVHPHKILLAYERAKRYAILNNIKIYNATRGGKLEVFNRADFDSLFYSKPCK